eukprot:1829561-Amphidinium_carterae.1
MIALRANGAPAKDKPRMIFNSTMDVYNQYLTLYRTKQIRSLIVRMPLPNWVLAWEQLTSHAFGRMMLHRASHRGLRGVIDDECDDDDDDDNDDDDDDDDDENNQTGLNSSDIQ